MKYIILVIILLSGYNCQAQKVEGVITYFYNDYQGDKPDIGATVFAIPSYSLPNLNTKLLDSFYWASYNMYYFSEYQTMYNSIKGRRKTDKLVPQSIKDSYAQFKDSLIKYGVLDPTKFDTLDRRNAIEVLNLHTAKERIETVVDGSGSYKIELPNEGDYYIFIVSKNRRGIYASNLLGKYYFKPIRIEKGKTKNISYNFDLK